MTGPDESPMSRAHQEAPDSAPEHAAQPVAQQAPAHPVPPQYLLGRSAPAAKWDGLRLWVRENGTRLMTPMFLVIVALGTTDLLFALDSIPAIYGLTKEPYLVFTANVFALMGLRQLYFLLGDMLKRLVYLSQGLAFILFFIGVKLILHALHENELPFINGGEPLHVPEIPTLASLAVIVVTLLVTTVASLYKTRRTAP
ncbi:Integral membrane protein TerC (tellurium resistance) [Mycobacteroides abscessus subsp. abscessus]|nr:Integral membrane protein TerC (tellurium resistance) [Mycobacteroides abscessus subsp. abscessus]